VLKPNYRGSAGYGEKFRALNVRISASGTMRRDFRRGCADRKAGDKDRLGSMGWSQGGYISRSSRHRGRFKAVSVGAGISGLDDVLREYGHHAFTRQYLHARLGTIGNYKRTSRSATSQGQDADANPNTEKRPRVPIQTRSNCGRRSKTAACGKDGCVQRIRHESRSRSSNAR